MKKTTPLDAQKIFHPRGVAIIGASMDRGRIGGHPIHATLKAGFKGRIYPVNPKYEEIQGLRCYPDVEAIDGPCDLAIVAIRAELVPSTIAACGKAGIPNVVVLAAGFREIGEHGHMIEQNMLDAARENGVRVIGPNCQGLVSVHEGLFAAFGSVADELGLRAGSVSAAFQSGGFGYAIVNLAEASGIGFRYCVSSGNETDVTMPEILDCYIDDPGTALSFAYIEGVTDGRRLMQTGWKSLERGKPLLLWKGAKTDIGARAAASHTANLTGSYDIYRTAFDTCGILEVNDVEQIVDLSKVFLAGRLPKGNGVGVLGISGGSGIVFADEAIIRGLNLPDFSSQTINELKKIVPSFGSVNNPADVTAGVFNDVSILNETINIVLRDSGVHQLVLLLASMSGKHATQAARAIAVAAAETDKPVIVGWSGRRSRAEEAYAILEEAGVPILSTPVRSAYAASEMARFADARRRYLAHSATVDVRGTKVAPVSALAPKTLNEADSKRILTDFDIPVTREVSVNCDVDTAIAAIAAADLRFPLAVKVLSTDIPHKSDVGGVALNLKNGEAVRAAYEDMAARLGPRALLMEMAPKGTEVAVGALWDTSFGPIVILSAGGVLIELIQDTIAAIAPFDAAEALRMISQMRIARVLDGVRGEPAANLGDLARQIAAFSQMVAALGDSLAEIDVNPVICSARGAIAVDCLAIGSRVTSIDA